MPKDKIKGKQGSGCWASKRSCLVAEAGESRLVLGVDVGTSSITAAASAAGVSSTGTTLATALTTTSTTAATAATSTTTTAGALRLNEARVKVNSLLDLALTLTQLLAVLGGEVIYLVILKGGGGSPLLVGLAAFVGSTGLQVATDSELLLSLLGEVVGE